MNEKRLEKTFLEMVKINGPPLKERPVADYLREQFSHLGLEMEEDDAAKVINGNCGNLIIRMPGEKPEAPGIIFSTHLDTILPTENLQIIEKNGVFYSDGSTILGADDRIGVAVLLELARTLTEEGGSPLPLEFLFTVAEEKGLLGVKNLGRDWLKGKSAFILDGGGPVGRAVNQAPFGEKIRVTIKGKSAHAGVEPEAGVSAIVIASRAIATMKLGRISEMTTANIGKIQGGEAQNIVPEKAEVVGEARSLKEEALLQQVQHMEESFKAAALELGGEIEFYSERDYPGYRLPGNSPEVSLVRKAAKRLGITLILESSGGASDANFISGLGIPALNLSVGYTKPHTKEESVSREELIRAGKLVYEIVKEAGRAE